MYKTQCELGNVTTKLRYICDRCAKCSYVVKSWSDYCEILTILRCLLRLEEEALNTELCLLQITELLLDKAEEWCELLSRGWDPCCEKEFCWMRFNKRLFVNESPRYLKQILSAFPCVFYKQCLHQPTNL